MRFSILAPLLNRPGLLIGVVALGCSGDPPRLNVPKMDARGAGQEALAEYDTNKDGKISGAELDRCPALKASLKHLDRDHDGALTVDEIAARIDHYIASKNGIWPLVFSVTMDGKPIDGAQVTFVPEKFMGPNVEPAQGMSNGGMVQPSIEKTEVRGIRSGFYKVTVSLKDSSGAETIPPQYNADTILGVEIGKGTPAVDVGWEAKMTSRPPKGSGAVDNRPGHEKPVRQAS